MEEKSIESLAEELGRAALKHGARIATAESCTAGGISYAITSTKYIIHSIFMHSFSRLTKKNIIFITSPIGFVFIKCHFNIFFGVWC